MTLSSGGQRRQEQACEGKEAGSGDSQLVIPSPQAQLLSPVAVIHGGSVRWCFCLVPAWPFLFPPSGFGLRPLLSPPHLPY